MDTPNRRRIFLRHAVAAGTAVLTSRVAAQGAPKLQENDPQAMALGYKEDTTKADKAKFPKHDPSQKCSNCQFYLGKPTDAMGPCSVFGGKQVAANGWCSTWVKKAA
jgi:hypothetical protein